MAIDHHHRCAAAGGEAFFFNHQRDAVIRRGLTQLDTQFLFDVGDDVLGAVQLA